MIDWRDEGVILSVRPHGESAALTEVFTATHGRHAGLVRGGAGRKLAPVLQPGSQVEVVWKARIEDHLGTYTVEPIRSRAGLVMGDRIALAGLSAVTALLSAALPEREAHGPLYDRTVALLDLLGQGEIWPLAYLRWEVALLAETGFALDLTACAVTGAREGLAYVSPRTGRAVARDAAGEWESRLLPLPPVLRGEGDAGPQEIVAALEVTGYFLRNHLMRTLGETALAPARARLIEVLVRSSG